MAITFNETTRIFTLTTAHTTYQMQVPELQEKWTIFWIMETVAFLEIRIQQAATEPILWMHCHRNIHHLAQEISEIMR